MVMLVNHAYPLLPMLPPCVMLAMLGGMAQCLGRNQEGCINGRLKVKLRGRAGRRDGLEDS